MTDEEKRCIEVARAIGRIEAEMVALRSRLMELIQEWQKLKGITTHSPEPEWGGPEWVITETGE